MKLTNRNLAIDFDIECDGLVSFVLITFCHSSLSFSYSVDWNYLGVCSDIKTAVSSCLLRCGVLQERCDTLADLIIKDLPNFK